MKKLDNKGLSLVELILAISMSTIVVGAAAMFLYNAERSYRTAEYSVDLQMEAQLLMEQMGNWVMESNHIIIGGPGSDASVLVLYKIPRGDKLSSVDISEKGERRTIYLSHNKLYIKIDEEENPGDYLAEIYGSGPDLSFTTGAPDEEYCIGQYVEIFNVALPVGVEDPYITSIDVKLGMHEGISRQSQSYTVNNLFSIRNSDVLNED